MKVYPESAHENQTFSQLDLYIQLPCSPDHSFPTPRQCSVLPDTVPTSLEDAQLIEGIGSTQRIPLKTVLGKDNLRWSERWL